MRGLAMGAIVVLLVILLVGLAKVRARLLEDYRDLDSIDRFARRREIHLDAADHAEAHLEIGDRLGRRLGPPRSH